MATLLYIEDDESLRQLVRLLISRRDDVDLIDSETGKAGVALAIQESPELILIDISLPDMLGNEVLKQLRNNPSTTTTPAIAISGNDLEETKATSPGFDAYLAKPINIQELYATIDLFIK